MTESNTEAKKSSQASHNVNILPVFPLPIFLLTGGMQRLRIFEAKYVAMVANANETDGFVMSVYDQERAFNAADWGAHVKIVDFDQGEDGILQVDVLAVGLVSLSDFSYQQDGLLLAHAETLPHWSVEPSLVSDWSKQQNTEITSDKLSFNNSEEHQQFSTVLQGIFQSHKPLNDLYKEQYFDYYEWVCARLLEIIPLSLTEKEKFVKPLQLEQLTKLLDSLCEKDK
ncbi:LON peptidase substrate-binding domain-containing protein [Vibrio sp. MA40-2]|uniref:LON peptidase substrate-binding domain-containing protein n=1 Tax=Vibrio sp. MA40-2 TaxID=3391828 RepID=UPI0039A53E7F